MYPPFFSRENETEILRSKLKYVCERRENTLSLFGGILMIILFTF